MVVEDKSKFESSVKKHEIVIDPEKRTVSIRLSALAIEKLEKRVDKLKRLNKIPKKSTVSSYISNMVDNFACESLNDKGDL